MYRPAAFDVTDPEEAYRLVEESGPAHLVTATPEGPLASVVPMLLDRERGPSGALLGHLARANPHWRSAAGRESLAILPGPDAYVSPSLYETKATSGEVVPTWNYVAAHVHGELIVHDDVRWVADLVTRLTDHHEGRRPEPWAVSDAPDAFVQRQLRAIVGIELVIDRVEAVRKLSQNRPHEDVAGVIAGLADGTHPEREVAREMRHWSSG